MEEQIQDSLNFEVKNLEWESWREKKYGKGGVDR